MPLKVEDAARCDFVAPPFKNLNDKAARGFIAVQHAPIFDRGTAAMVADVRDDIDDIGPKRLQPFGGGLRIGMNGGARR